MYGGRLPTDRKGARTVGDAQALTTVISCRKCGSPIPLEIAVVRMGGAQLFVCPACLHQEVWRAPLAPTP